MNSVVRRRYIWWLTVVPTLTSVAALFSTDLLGQTDSITASALVWMAGVAATVVLAALDWDSLSRAGVVHPFHWAWCFFSLANLSIVYVAGRTAVARRSGVGGTGPVWLSAGLLGLTVVLSVTVPLLVLVLFLSQGPE